MALEANSALPKVTNVKPLFSPESLPFIIQTCWHRPKWHWYKSSQKPLRRLHYIEMELTSVTSPIDPQKSSKSSSEAGKKLTFCIPTIAQMEKKKKTRRVSFILNTVKLFSQKNNSEILYIYLRSTFICQNLKITNKRRNDIKSTPTSWLTAHPISIYNLKIILNLQSN